MQLSSAEDAVGHVWDRGLDSPPRTVDPALDARLAASARRDRPGWDWLWERLLRPVTAERTSADAAELEEPAA